MKKIKNSQKAKEGSDSFSKNNCRTNERGVIFRLSPFLYHSRTPTPDFNRT